MKIKKVIAAVPFVLFSFACTQEKTTSETSTNATHLFTKLSTSETGIEFKNEIVDKNEFNIFRYRNFYNGGGVAIGDINNDGLPDIFFTANMQANRLYLNKGNLKFEDITASAGVAGRKPWDTGVLMVDVNADGLLDIYVSNAGNMEGDNHDNDLYINNGDLTFTERAKEYNLAKSGFSTHASFFDYDKDGDLDAYLLNNSNVPVSTLGNAGDRNKRASDWENIPKKFRGMGDLLLRNDNGKFVDVSKEAGTYGSLIGFGLGVMVSDINDDTYPDIYITNDFYERDYLYINQQDGTFSEEIVNWTSHLSLSAMGVDIADINNDGLKDVVVTDMLPEKDERTKSVMEFDTYDVFKLKQERDFYQQYIQNTLQVNNGNNSFSEIAYYSGIARTDWSWACLLFDMDNDGYRDLYITNGIIHDLTDIDFVDFLANEVVREIEATGDMTRATSIINKMPTTKLSNYAYRNNKDLTFKNATGEWGLEAPSFSSGCAYGDLDLDGDLDLVVNNVNMEAFIFRNESRQITKNNYLQFQLKGAGGNTFAIGASVRLYFEGKQMVQEVVPSRGFQSSMDYLMTIGLGDQSVIDSISILWPDNKITILKDVKTNQKLTLSQAEASDWEPETKRVRPTLFKKVENTMVPHKEDHFDDFDQERLVTRHLSKEGPSLAIGDINNDGNEDIFVGGAKDQPATVYLHRGNGQLTSTVNECFEIDARFEDTAAAFFDADNDGDQDLVVGTGGNIAAEKDSYITRLYLNDGKGKFVKSSSNLPSTKTNTSVIAPHDFDNDGDVDLFVGARSVPGIFGANPQHQLLINDGKANFTDATERYAYELKGAGMVTGAKWVDVDRDAKQDLVVVSEWGSPLILRNSGRRLEKMESNLDSLSGWWKTMETADLDNDGDQDFIFGNNGLNVPYPGTKDKPMKLWINDFDENGTIEQIMTSHYDNGDHPVHMRKEVTAQLPSLKKQNLKASDYSKRTIQELFKEDVVANSMVKEVNTSESIVAVNEGNGKFSIVKLPPQVQWSCVCGISCSDVNNDGFLDLIMAGNDYELKPQFSRQDASGGNVLIGDGKLNFTWENYAETGFFIREQVRHLNSFSDKRGNKFIFAAINNGEPKVFKFNY